MISPASRVNAHMQYDTWFMTAALKERKEKTKRDADRDEGAALGSG